MQSETNFTTAPCIHRQMSTHKCPMLAYASISDKRFFHQRPMPLDIVILFMVILIPFYYHTNIPIFCKQPLHVNVSSLYDLTTQQCRHLQVCHIFREGQHIS